MNLRKFISGVSALAIAASTFAGMAVTASAAVDQGKTTNWSQVEDVTPVDKTTGNGSFTALGSGWAYHLRSSGTVKLENGVASVKATGSTNNQYLVYTADTTVNSENKIYQYKFTAKVTKAASGSNGSASFWTISHDSFYTLSSSEWNYYTNDLSAVSMGLTANVAYNCEIIADNAKHVLYYKATNTSDATEVHTNTVNYTKTSNSNGLAFRTGNSGEVQVSNFSAYTLTAAPVVTVTNSVADAGAETFDLSTLVSGATNYSYTCEDENVIINGSVADISAVADNTTITFKVTADNVTSGTVDDYEKTIETFTIAKGVPTYTATINTTAFAHVVIKNGSGNTVAEGNSNSNGIFSATLSDGTYPITVTKGGYTFNNESIIIDGADNSQTVNGSSEYLLYEDFSYVDDATSWGLGAASSGEALPASIKTSGVLSLDAVNSASGTRSVRKQYTFTKGNADGYEIEFDNVMASDSFGDYIAFTSAYSLAQSPTTVFAFGKANYGVATAYVEGTSSLSNHALQFANPTTQTFGVRTNASGGSGTYHVKAILDYTAHKATVTVTQGSTPYTYDMPLSENAASAINGLYITATTWAGLPNTFDNITIKRYTAPSYTVDKASTTNGSFDVDRNTAKAGQTVTITTDPADGYEVDAITGVTATKTGDNTYTFIMPAENVTVNVTFKEVDTTKVQYFVFNGKAGVMYDTLYITVTDASTSKTGHGAYTPGTKFDLGEGSLALMVEDVPANITINSITLQ